jgi:hypothetical protein
MSGSIQGQNRTFLNPEELSQKADRQQTDLPKRPRISAEVLAIIDLASAVPPEFGADVLIRLVESNQIPDHAKKIDLLKRSFELAESAEQPVKRTALPGSAVDTRSGYLDSAYSMNLDTLSLQSRVVNNMLTLDRTVARDLFNEIRLPKLTPLPCEEPLAYDLSPFYESLANVFRSGFAIQERREGRDIALLTSNISNFQSHSQFVSIVKMLQSLDLSPAQLGDISGLLAGSLQALKGDERSFTNAIRSGTLASTAGLIVQLNAKRVPSFAVLQALRVYLVSNFREASCADIMRKPAEKSSLREAAQYFVADFDKRLQATGQSGEIAPISEDELAGARVGPGPSIHYYWKSASTKELLADIQRLRFGDKNTPISVSERTKSEWGSRLTDFVTKLESWRPDSEPEDDFFHEKSVLYESLIELIPRDEPERLKVIKSYVGFLEQNSHRKSRSEWFLHVENLLSRLSPAVHTEGRTDVLRAFLSSSDPILNLYALVAQSQPPAAAQKFP